MGSGSGKAMDGDGAGREETRRSASSYFESVAESWEEMRGAFFTEGVREKAIEGLAPKRGDKAADIGAGSGFMTEELLRRGVEVIAIDGSEAMIEQMRARFGSRPDLDLRPGDAEALPVDDASVDHCVANMFLHHVERPGVALREMFRILRPGGRVAITDLESHEFEFLLREHHDRWPGFEPGEVVRWMEEAGLRDARVESLGEQCCATSEDGCSEAKVGIFLATGRRP